MNISGSNIKHPLDPKILPINNHSRRFGEIKTYSQKGNTVTIVDTCVKNRGSFSSLDPVPSSLLLQGGGALAKHPLSFHPRRCVWQQRKWKRKGKKMKQRENGS